MSFRSGCMVCGKELLYLPSSEPVKCHYCGAAGRADVRCAGGHYVCDGCHRASANDHIERWCTESDSAAPIDLAIALMKFPGIKMNGPEHHFLVPAVLLASYCTATGRTGEVAGLLRAARERAEKLGGGMCGTHGSCAAAIGAGIFVSLITGATPLSVEEWRLSNLATAECLRSIAEHGGPRCCKRTTFLAIMGASRFLTRNFGLTLPVGEQVICEFNGMNAECIGTACPFFKGSRG